MLSKNTYLVSKDDEGRTIITNSFSRTWRYFETDEDYKKFMNGELFL